MMRSTTLNLRGVQRFGNLAPEKLKGRGRLFPAQATGIEYPVEFGSIPRHRRRNTDEWRKRRVGRSVRFVRFTAAVFPDGTTSCTPMKGECINSR